MQGRLPVFPYMGQAIKTLLRGKSLSFQDGECLWSSETSNWASVRLNKQIALKLLIFSHPLSESTEITTNTPRSMFSLLWDSPHCLQGQIFISAPVLLLIRLFLTGWGIRGLFPRVWYCLGRLWELGWSLERWNPSPEANIEHVVSVHFLYCLCWRWDLSTSFPATMTASCYTASHQDRPTHIRNWNLNTLFLP